MKPTLTPAQVVNALRAFRKQTGLSQEKAAFRLGYEAASQLSRYETGARTPSLLTALMLSRLYGVQVWALFPNLWSQAVRRVRPVDPFRPSSTGGTGTIWLPK